MKLNTPFAGQGEATTRAVPNDKSLWTELLTYWTDRRGTEKAWLLPRSEETARVAEHAIGTCRSLLSANHLAAEALCNVARQQQAIAFDVARAAIGADPAREAGTGLDELGTAWKRIATAYTEVNLHGLEVAQAMTDTTFKVLRDTSEAAFATRSARAPRP